MVNGSLVLHSLQVVSDRRLVMSFLVVRSYICMFAHWCSMRIVVRNHVFNRLNGTVTVVRGLEV